MGKSVTFETTLDLERAKREALDRLRREGERAISDEVTALQLRTQAGLDIDGRPFVPYSPEYREAKQKYSGRGSKPDLISFNVPGSKQRNRPGSMLANITHTLEQVGSELIGKVFFASTAEAQKARYNQTTRRFFGFSEEQVRRIQERLRKVINGN